MIPVSYHLYKRKKRTKATFLKTISTVLVAGFLFQEMSYAGLEIRPIEWGKEEKPQVSLNLPESVAVVEDAWKGSSGGGRGHFNPRCPRKSLGAV